MIPSENHLPPLRRLLGDLPPVRMSDAEVAWKRLESRLPEPGAGRGLEGWLRRVAVGLSLTGLALSVSLIVTAQRRAGVLEAQLNRAELHPLVGQVAVAAGPAAPKPLTQAEPVAEGSRIVTQGGEASLRIADGSQALVEPNSTLRVQRLKAGAVELDLGAGAVSIHAAHVAPGDLSVRAGPYRVVVHGTSFRVVREAERLGVQLWHGSVEIEGALGSRMLRPGEQISDLRRADAGAGGGAPAEHSRGEWLVERGASGGARPCACGRRNSRGLGARSVAGPAHAGLEDPCGRGALSQDGRGCAGGGGPPGSGGLGSGPGRIGVGRAGRYGPEAGQLSRRGRALLDSGPSPRGPARHGDSPAIRLSNPARRRRVGTRGVCWRLNSARARAPVRYPGRARGRKPQCGYRRSAGRSARAGPPARLTRPARSQVIVPPCKSRTSSSMVAVAVDRSRSIGRGRSVAVALRHPAR